MDDMPAGFALRTGYGYSCAEKLWDLRDWFKDGLISMREFSDGVAAAIKDDDCIPF
jgi:hypothetical protein